MEIHKVERQLFWVLIYKSLPLKSIWMHEVLLQIGIRGL